MKPEREPAPRWIAVSATEICDGRSQSVYTTGGAAATGCLVEILSEYESRAAARPGAATREEVADIIRPMRSKGYQSVEIADAILAKFTLPAAPAVTRATRDECTRIAESIVIDWTEKARYPNDVTALVGLIADAILAKFPLVAGGVVGREEEK